MTYTYGNDEMECLYSKYAFCMVNFTIIFVNNVPIKYNKPNLYLKSTLNKNTRRIIKIIKRVHIFTRYESNNIGVTGFFLNKITGRAKVPI